MKEKFPEVYVIEWAEYQLLVAARVPLGSMWDCEVYTVDVFSFLFTFKGKLQWKKSNLKNYKRRVVYRKTSNLTVYHPIHAVSSHVATDKDPSK